MSDSPQLEPESFEHPLAAPDPTTEQEEREAGPYLAHLVRTLAAHGGGVHSADLALDLILNEIVEQARLASTATAAAIGLLTGDDLICRATTGANAPGLGVRLAMNSGLTGACVERLEPQKCDDTETDPRVEALAYRNLEIRSILMVPILDGESLLGVFQIFSPRANEFGDREVQTLHALSRRIVNNVALAAENDVVTEIAEDIPVKQEKPIQVESEAVAPLHLLPDPPFTTRKNKDYWTSLLTGLVIALAVLLGWMAGRDGERSATGKSAVSATAQRPSLSKAAVPAAPEKTTDVLKKPIAPTGPEGISNAGLVVYEKGRIIYQARPAKSSLTKTGEPLSTLSPEMTASLLVHRVEPEYPEPARNASIEGDVAMRVIVDSQGAVRQVSIESGDDLLSPAAVEAVRQWRFTPYHPKDVDQEFQTRVIVRFKLP